MPGPGGRLFWAQPGPRWCPAGIAYRARPEGLDPHRTLWDVWSLTMLPAGETPARDEPVEVDYRDEAAVGRVLHQDFCNLEDFWAGLQSRACDIKSCKQTQRRY